MAFLDNSGDIIMDAVLTDEGRRRMANGNFSITKFALGDDEIDYSLYNKNHPSGSSYYDLEILQTPVFEAFTQINATINYGLLDTSATDLLYLPVAKINELSTLTLNPVTSYGGIFYVRDTTGDTSSATIADRMSGVISSCDGASNPSGQFVLFETGLDTGFGNVPVGTAANQNSYLIANGLIDTSFYVFYDSRFFSSIDGAEAASTFTNSGTSNTFNGTMTLAAGTPSSIDVGIANYSTSRINGIENGVYYYTTNNTEQSYSAIGGPRANVSALAPIVQPGLDAQYTLFGSTGQSISGLTGTYDIIDTTIYVQGATTSATLQIPFRIIKVRS